MYKGSSESAHVKIPHCLKSHVSSYNTEMCVYIPLARLSKKIMSYFYIMCTIYVKVAEVQLH